MGLTLCQPRKESPVSLSTARAQLARHPRTQDQHVQDLVHEFRAHLDRDHMPNARTVAITLHQYLASTLPPTPTARAVTVDHTLTLLNPMTPTQYAAISKALPH